MADASDMREEQPIGRVDCLQVQRGRDGKGALVQEGVSGTLATGNDQTIFQPSAFFVQSDATTKVSEEVANTIRVGGDGGSNQHVAQPTNTAYVVRRLTPRECERLQGFPDDWTRVPHRGKLAEECPDGPRYKALGNSFAVPNVRWIFERIQAYETIRETPVG